MNNNFMGKDGFHWWQGVVEDRHDPLMIGRCKVRILGHHTDDKSTRGIPTEDLPWAQLLLPVNQEERIVPPKEGSWVMGFFRDPQGCHDPVIMGVIPGIPEENSPNLGLNSEQEKGFFDPVRNVTNRPVAVNGFDVSYHSDGVTVTQSHGAMLSGTNTYPGNIGEPDTHRLARGEDLDKTCLQWKVNHRVTGIVANNNSANTVTTTSWDEPDPTKVYNSKYPYNKVMASESGHVQEIDDTPGYERIHTFHRSGTFDEMQPNGDRVQKTVGNHYRIIYKDEYYLCLGTKHETFKNNKTDQYYSGKGEIIGGKKYAYCHDGNSMVVKTNECDYVGKTYYLTVQGNDGANGANAMNFLAEKGNIRITARNNEGGELHLKSDYQIRLDAAQQAQILSLGDIHTQAIENQSHCAGTSYKIVSGGNFIMDAGSVMQIQSHSVATIGAKDNLTIGGGTVGIGSDGVTKISGSKVYINCDTVTPPSLISVTIDPVKPAKPADHVNVGDMNIVTPATLEKS